MKIKEFILSIFFICSILIIYGLFPVKNNFQQFIVMAVVFVIMPIIFNRFILKKELKVFKVETGDWKQGLIWGGISIIIMGVILLITYYFDFLKNYTIPIFITNNYTNFIFYEILLVAPVIFMYDFFFRGFMMSVLEDKITYWAIIIQSLLFLMLVVATGSLKWTLAPYLISAPLSGLVVYKSGSILYSIIFQFIVLLMLNASIIYLVR